MRRLVSLASARIDHVEALPDAGPPPSLAGALATANPGKITVHAHSSAPGAGALIDIPKGSYASGSTPGDEGREPGIEPALVDVALDAYQIDALPYPNDPKSPPKTGVTQAEATQLCAEKNERLCTELEWEHACKGPGADGGDMFASGAAWDQTCDSDIASCASGFGVRGMGSLPEFTASTFSASDTFVVRGSKSSAAGTDITAAKRCAFRGKLDSATAKNVGFRCCKGTANTAEIKPIESHQAFRKTNMDAAQFSKIVATLPELSKLGGDVRFYEQGDVNGVTARSGAAHNGIVFAWQPILWSPETGTEMLVATGRTKGASFVVALYPLAHEKYRVASSFIMLNDLSPVLLAYEPTNRKQLLWSACWGCAGEQGAVSVREDHKTLIVQY